MQAKCSTAVVPETERESPNADLRAALLEQYRAPRYQELGATTAARVLAYERVSKSVQVSIPDQQRAIEDDVAKHGMEITRHRWDVGSRWDDERPDYRALLSDIESGEFTHLWLFNADRLGGDDQEFVATVRKARKRNMVVRDTVHGVIDDVLASILGLISYMEIKHNHYRVMNALTGKHLDGVKLGSVPPGYEPQCKLHPCRCGLHGKHLPVEPRASQVKELFRRYASGESLTAVRSWWNTETGERRDYTSIKRILRNPYYVGIIVNCRTHNGRVEDRGKRKQEEWKVGTHDRPIIDPATFATVQERLRSQENVGQHREHGVSHELVGLVHCVQCGRRLHRSSTRLSSAVWECPLCNRSRSVRKVDQAVRSLLANIPFPEDDAVQDYAQQQARMQRALEQELAAIRAERDRIQRRRSQWADDRGDGTMSKDLFREKIAESDKQLEELRCQEAALRDSHIGQPGRAVVLEEVRAALRSVVNWTTDIEHMTPEERRGMYRCMLKAVRLDLEGGWMTVEYTDALARWYGRSSDTVALPSQKAKRGS